MSALKNFWLNTIARRCFPRNIWPVIIGTSSCSLEFWAAWRECEYFAPSPSLEHFPPEQADVLIIYGHVNKKMLSLVLDIYHRMPEDKKVMLVGSRTFEVTDHIEVDVSVPGDPPSKKDILTGLEKVSTVYLQQWK